MYDFKLPLLHLAKFVGVFEAFENDARIHRIAPNSDQPPGGTVLRGMTGYDPRSGPNAHLLAADGPIEQTVRRPVRNALIISIVSHAIALVLGAIVATRLPTERDKATHVAQNTAHITWIAPSNPGDGGAGSGNKAPAPARPMQRPGVDAVALPTKPLSSTAQLDKPAIPEPLNLPAVPTTAGVKELPGVITTLTSTALDSDGPGTGGRQGAGRGTGLGPGNGDSGMGPGSNGGPGGNGYLPGNGVLAPRLIREVKPAYTSEAMRARIQGMVRLQAIVLPDGSVGNMKIVRSLDNAFGLDEEALKSVGQWRFQPGTLAGRAVPVLIEVELAFTLR
jgi:protein TonB